MAAHLPLKQLAEICRRLSTTLHAGVDLRAAWKREAERVGGRCGAVMREVGLALDRGQSLHEALIAADLIFPPLLVELVGVAEHTGHLPEICRSLAQAFEQQLRLRRQFVARIVWPLTELAISVLIVGFMIWIMGLVAPKEGPVDVLGLGLVGRAGLAVYATCVAALCGLGYGVYRLVRPGGPWAEPIGRVLRRTPMVGKALEVASLARLSAVLGLTLNTSMDVFRALALGVQSSGDARLIAGLPQVEAAVTAGRSVHDALAAGGEYPGEFLAMVDVGEQSGNLAEAFDKLGRRYHEEAEARFSLLARAASFLVWLAVAAAIIFVVFRIVHFYLGMLAAAGKP